MCANSSKDNLLEPFRVALRLEQEGKQFFLDAARNTTSDLARQTFEFLAAEEDKHIAKIEGFYKSIEKSGTDDLPEAGDSDAEQRLAEFNDTLSRLREEYKVSMSDAEAYKVAMKFENGAEEFYARRAAEADDPRIKKFYQWLHDEESMHERLLKSCLLFVEDPANWFKVHKRGK